MKLSIMKFCNLKARLGSVVLTMACVLSSPCSSFGESKSDTSSYSEVLQSTLSYGFPVIVITTEDNVYPTVEYVTPPEGCIGWGTINATKVPGSVDRYEVDGTCSFSSGEYVKKESGMTVKIRGNSSAWREQKPYKIKLQSKGDLLNRGDKKYNDKNWALIAEVGWYEWMGLELSKLIHNQWSPNCEWVSVIFNGSFHGIYLLTETIERNVKARVDVSDEGFIAEKDPYWWTEGEEYISSDLAPLYNYTMKYPEFEDMEQSQMDFVRSELDPLLKLTKEEGYDEFIDVDSWVDFVLIHDFMGTMDAAGCNVYYTKYDSDSKIGMGPAWDFDNSARAEGFSATHTEEGNFRRLFSNADHTFIDKYIKRYEEVASEANALLESMINEGPCDPAKLDRVLDATKAVVNHRIYSHSEAKEKIGSWFEQHKVALEAAVNELKATSYVENLEEDKIKLIISHNTVVVSGLTEGQPINIYSADGTLLNSQCADSNGTVNCSLIDYKGIVIVYVAEKAFKVAL